MNLISEAAISQALLIPAYNPDDTLVEVVRGTLERLGDAEIVHILVVDDGSTSSAAPKAFDVLREDSRVVLVVHPVNRGKGAALKTGIAEIRRRWPDASRITTADADGQHLPADIARMIGASLVARPDVPLILGTRAFDRSEMPLRSWIGNSLTPLLFKLFTGRWIADTQSGLRSLSAAFSDDCGKIERDGYDFEFEMLFRALRGGGIDTIPISRVYQPGNPTSHFNPVLDSVLIYFVFVRHVSVVATFYVAEMLALSVLVAMRLDVFYSFVCVRLLAIAIYFGIARQFTFRSLGSPIPEFTKLSALIAFNLVVIAGFSRAVGDLGPGLQVTLVLAVQALLFVFNFVMQRRIVFT